MASEVKVEHRPKRLLDPGRDVNDRLSLLTRGWYNGTTLPAIGAVTWFDDGTPWAVFTVEDLVYNVDVREYVRAKGL